MRTRPPTASIPDEPGCYRFLDDQGRVLYVGKAKSLRQRLSSYWQDPAALAPRTAQMVGDADRVEWMVVGTELEALVLEHSLIQTDQPRFNVRLKDDKSYPWLAVTVSDEWPRPAVVRGTKKKGVRYFGPYAHVGAIRETLDLLLRSFPVRSCSDTKYRRHERMGRPCLLFDIERCSGPCIGEVGKDEYAGMVENLMRFLAGDTRDVIKGLRREMDGAATAMEYERAARYRDRITAVEKAAETQQVVLDTEEDLDVIGITEDDLEAAVQIFHVRRGRVVGRHGFILDKVEDLDRPALVGRVLEQRYGSDETDHVRMKADKLAGSRTRTEIPRRILVPSLPEDAALFTEWLGKARGRPVELAVPQRGAKKALFDTVTRNSTEDLHHHRLRRASDHASRSRALVELQEALGLRSAPLRIECYDMSHLQGTDYVGSMVVFEDGLPKRSDYRRFAVKTVSGNDDYAAMAEVLTRRLTALLADEATGPDDRKSRHFAYPPDLLLLDGGKGQLGVGVKVAEELGLFTRIELASLAKQFEEVYRPGRSKPERVPRGSDALYLLQRIRDEAHRFAVSYHREKRGRRMTTSVLDGVAGLGPARRARLVKEMGGITKVKQAERDDFRALTWLPAEVAEALVKHLHGPSSPTGRTVGETVRR